MRDFDSIPKHFEPCKTEQEMYQQWADSGCFKPVEDQGQECFAIVMPPPNITGQLHMGHALDLSMQDIAVRFKRMQGKRTVYVPGTDHASIATEAKVVEKLRNEGREKREIGREAFLKEAWDWNDKYGSKIVEQTRRLGISCDWSRQRFTLDEGLSKAVLEAFCRLYEKGYIYRGERMINWCADCGTSISDAEIDYEEADAKFYYLKYPLKGQPDKYLEIATTRPETMLGDTAVAVHPDDERYAALVGEKCILPLVERELEIISDNYVEADFGSGCVKITPAHDPNDFEIGLRHDLEIIDVITDDGKINELGGVYAGLSINDCREQIVRDLEAKGYLIKVEDMKHNIALCSRCHSVIEPKLSLQWWVAMEELAKPAIAAVKDGSIEFIPDHFVKTYLNWMENIRDWCISRQLWWGHRIPAWYCEDCEEINVSREVPTECSHCHSTHLKQDEDTLDTWFSSALWPFSTLGWPEQTKDLADFYPNNLLITGYDILPLWVSRMIFSGLEHTGQVPFRQVGYHGLVRDDQGRKMSKSLGNGIDPLEIIDSSGADSLRYALFWGTSVGKDMRFSEQKVEAGRNFMNKLWNALRFYRMNLGDSSKTVLKLSEIDSAELKLEDKWILDQLNELIKDSARNFERLDFSLALEKISHFAWDQFCDWYVEIVKDRLNQKAGKSREIALAIMNHCLSETVKLLHPIMPFVTEAIYAELLNTESLLISAQWPEYQADLEFKEAAENMEQIINAVRGIRNVRAEQNVPAGKEVDALIYSSDQAIVERFMEAEAIFRRLARVAELKLIDSLDDLPENTSSVALPKLSLHLPLADLIDWAQERERLEKESQNLEQLITAQERKLANQNFVQRAPAQVVDAEREKLKNYEALLKQTNESLANLPKS
ncbi:MAG: valine--tRNA ligase [Eubacteriales bacterium]|nr:valine--tRNA ligase [Eubacteriales bacterium]